MRKILRIGLAAGLVCGLAACGTAVEPIAPSPPAGSPSTTPLPSAPPPSPTPSPTSLPSLAGDTSNTWAFAPLDAPGEVVVEGSAPSQRAWSTSKVLVVAAFLDALGGDPEAMTAEQRDAAIRSLTESDLESLRLVRRAVPGGAPAAMQRILRSIGDSDTVVPDELEGTMTWSVREQVRFMAALAGGEVVSPEASRFLVDHMQPVGSQQWGLGHAGATAVKGGWLRSDTETRQMGILDGYAVAILTEGVGPAVQQLDGDAAHVEQMNKLAGLLAQRLAG